MLWNFLLKFEEYPYPTSRAISSIDLSVVHKQVLFLILVGGGFSIASLFLSEKINLISLGDETAASLGITPEKVKLQTVLYLIPICAVCVATAGNIGFIGLFIPHIIRVKPCIEIWRLYHWYQKRGNSI